MSPETYKVIGTPFSTFTRTVTLGLQYKGVPFDQVASFPHSDVARHSHPYGYLPTLVIADATGRTETKLCESQAIARYIDRIAPEPSLHLDASAHPEVLPERVWEVASLVGSFGFPAIEVGVVKPHMRAVEDGMAESDIIQNTARDVEKIVEFLRIVEERGIGTSKFLFGDHPTWADFYLYPPLADLQALPEWGKATAGSRFATWMDEMGQLDAVKKTGSGTLAERCGK